MLVLKHERLHQVLGTFYLIMSMSSKMLHIDEILNFFYFFFIVIYIYIRKQVK
jgi:hypothetical protein